MVFCPISKRILALFISLSSGIALAAEDRILSPVDPSRTVTLPGQVHPQARPQYDIGPVDSSIEIGYVTVLLQPAAGLEAFLMQQRDPASADYRRWLTPEQFGERFGLTVNDISKVGSWLRSQGLTVHDVARGRHWVTFSGTAGQLEGALRTPFHRFRVAGQMHIANTVNPSIPAALAGVIAGFSGLTDFDLKPANLRATIATPDYDGGTFHYIAPEDFSTIYDVAPLYQAGINGTGQTIAIVGRTDISVADITAFRKRFNLPVNAPKLVLYGPDPGQSSAGDLYEADIDLEWSGAVAPNATILYVYSKSITTSILYAVDQNLAQVLSESYGSCEPSVSPGLRSVAQQANAQGITWIAASGDEGAAQCDDTSPTQQASKGLTASFPATVPEVTGVGGTRFNEGSGKYWAASNDANGGSALGYIPEMAWNDTAERGSLSATGGGASVFFPKPIWQIGQGVPNDSARDVPDLAFAASPDHDGYLIVSSGNLLVFGGTSVGTPSFAGVAALLNHYLVSKGSLAHPGLGNVNPMFYRLALTTTDVFHDVTTGDNMVPCEQGSPNCVNGFLGFEATPAYDMTTGLGSLDVYHFVTEWTSGTASTTTLSANPTAFNLTDTIQLTATVSGAGRVKPTGTVTFLSNELTLATVPLTGGTASGSGSGMLIAGGNGTVSALYSGDAAYNASSAIVPVSLNLPASGSFVIPSVTPNPVNQSTTVWPYVVRLTEKAGVATKLTVFTINGVDNLAAFTSLNLPAHGTVFASLSGNGLTPPVNRDFHFEGVDGNGKTWAQDLTVPFIGPAGPGYVPNFTLTAAPASAQRNPSAVSSCQWSQQLTVQEQNGFLWLLQNLTAGSSDLSNQIQTLFGATRLAPYGSLQATVCWPSGSALVAKNYQLTAESELGSTLTATASTMLTAAAANPATLAVSPAVVEMLADSASNTGSAELNLSFAGSSPQWTVSVLQGKASSPWLTVSPISGTGSAQLNLKATGVGLSNGVYDATILVQAANAIPQSFNVRALFVVGGSPAMNIDSVANAADSSSLTLAPGAEAIVSGSNLAALNASAGLIPLPFSIDGVSATVNGISAPLYSIAPNSITLQVPYETGSGTAVLGINNNGQVGAYLFPVNAAAPQIFKSRIGLLSPASTAGQGQTVTAYITGEGDITPFQATGASAPTGTPTNQLSTPRLPLTVTVGGVKALVTFAGIPPGLVGVTQINFVVPANAATGMQQVVVSVGGVISAPVGMTVTAVAAK